MAAAKEAVRSGDTSELERVLVGRRIWVDTPAREIGERSFHALIRGPYRVLSFRKFHPADPPRRPLHLVQVNTDPGGMRTLSVGSICFHDPRKKRIAA